MSEIKKYYWLRFKEDFFKQKEIKKLRKIAGGDTFTIIYLKMQLLTVKTDGILRFDGIEETFAEELALELDEAVDNVKITLSFLQSTNLAEVISEKEYLLPEALNNIGSETDSAERVRKHRERKTLQSNIKTLQSNDNQLQSNGHVTNSNTELEIELKIKQEKEKKEDHFPFSPESQEVSKPEYNPVTRGNADAMTRIETARAYWNSKGSLPKYRYMAISMRPDDQGGALRTLGAYSDDEIKKAIDNYNTISTDDEYTPFPVYSTFAGFLKTGPENYGDDANPLDRCRKKQSGPKEMTVEEYKAKFYPEEVEQEEMEDDE